MKIYKHRHFARWARKEGLSDLLLRTVITEMMLGLYDADLGGGLYKKRVARAGEGKRGAYRTLLAFSIGNKAFFVYGYAKNECAEIGEFEKGVYKKLAKYLLSASDAVIQKLLVEKQFVEVS